MLELVNDMNLGHDIVLLSDIQEKDSLSTPVSCNKHLFMDEEFATFDFVERFIKDRCYFHLVSQIPYVNNQGWGVFNVSNVSLNNEGVDRRNHGKLTFCIQSFSLKLDGDFGYFQLICLPEKLIYDDGFFNQFDLLTFMVYKNRNVMKSVANPHLITLRPYFKQTYVPMIFGQKLQVISFDEENIEIYGDGLQYIQGSERLFSISNKCQINKLKSSTFRYLSNDKTVLSVGKNTISFPEINGRNYINIIEPSDNTVIYSEGIDGVKIECCEESLWNWDDSNLIVKSLSDGLDISLKKPTNSICIEYDGIMRWAFTSKNMVGKI